MNTDAFPAFRHRVGLLLLTILATGCWIGWDTPRKLKVADCTNSVLNFKLQVTTHDGYHFVMGVPFNTNGLDFRGTITISQSTGTVTRFPISSDDVHGCNPPKGSGAASAYFLTWSLTNRGDRLVDRLVKGQTYDVMVQFSNMPPPKSSLWFTSIGRLGWE